MNDSPSVLMTVGEQACGLIMPLTTGPGPILWFRLMVKVPDGIWRADL